MVYKSCHAQGVQGKMFIRDIFLGHPVSFKIEIISLLQVTHPNPNILVAMLVQEFCRAEHDVDWIKAGNSTKNKSDRYMLGLLRDGNNS